MLEVMFSDSEKGSMRVAKNYDENRMLGGAGSVGSIGATPTRAELEKCFAGKAVEGNPRDVVNIGFSLDVGDISGAIDGNERKGVYRQLWGRFGLDDQEEERFFQNQRKDLERLLGAATNGEPIRIWTSDAPYSSCGFHFVCNLLRSIDCRISVVSLPKYNPISENEIVEYSHWGEVQPGKFHQFLPLERQLTPLEKRVVSDHWHGLVVENALLRAVVNGKLTSVPEDFYDFLVTKNLPAGDDVLMARLIGKLLGEYGLGISDSWYAVRIDKLIEEKRITVAENKDPLHPYGRVLRKTGAF